MYEAAQTCLRKANFLPGENLALKHPRSQTHASTHSNSSACGLPLSGPEVQCARNLEWEPLCGTQGHSGFSSRTAMSQVSQPSVTDELEGWPPTVEKGQAHTWPHPACLLSLSGGVTGREPQRRVGPGQWSSKATMVTTVARVAMRRQDTQACVAREGAGAWQQITTSSLWLPLRGIEMQPPHQPAAPHTLLGTMGTRRTLATLYSALYPDLHSP